MKKIRGKSLQEWKEYSEKDIHNIPIRTRKYIIILEELVEQSLLFGVGIELPTELEVRSECVDYLYKFERENKMLGKSTLVRRGIEIGFIECYKRLKSNGN